MIGVQPLRGRRVVITRPEAEGGPLAKALARAGARAVNLPLLRIEPVIPRITVTADLDEYDHVIFTSANAVSCFVAQLGRSSVAQFRQHHGVAVIGPATRRTLETHKGRASITAETHVAESLVDALGDVSGKRILWPRAEEVRPVLAQSLRAGGADLVDVVVYRTVISVPADAPRAIAGADAVTFTSPSGVRAWSSALGAPDMRVVCIGPITARAATDNGFRVDAVANPYTIDGIMTALRSAFEATDRLS